MASIQKRPNGKWRARFRDETGREHTRHFDRKLDGQRWLDEVTTSVVTGRYVAPSAGRATLAEFFDAWSARQVWATGTRTAMRLAVRDCTFSDVELRSIRPSHVEQWVNTMHSRGLAAGTIKTRVNNVRAVLRGAARDKQIPEDPAEGVTLPRRRRAAAAMRIATVDEVGALLDAAEEWFRPFIALCAFAGLRLGEAAALKADDVVFLARQLRVVRQVQRADGGEVVLTAPKYGSERTVYLPDELLTMLARHFDEVGVFGAEQWLFPGANGNPPHQNTIGYWWRKTVAAAGVEPLRLHDLRHFYASGLIAQGCDVVTVQRALGHSSATTTLQTYSHLWPTAEDKTRAAAGGLMRSALDAPRTLADSVRTGAV